MASVEVLVEVNAEKTKYKFMSCEQNAGYHKIRATNISLKMW
jgi:hypothetical protein